MKNIFLALAILVSTISVAQQTDSSLSFYAATGLSMANSSNFEQSSYISAEVGGMYENVALAIVVGRNNLEGTFGSNESLNNYWYEGKVAVYQQVGAVDAYGLLGAGSYIENGDLFLEYGAGISKEFDALGVFIQVSNWDGVNYITPGVSFGL